MIQHISAVRRLKTFLFLVFLISTGVLASCPERMYFNTEQCVDCPEHCIYCNSSECYVCDEGYFGTNCTQQCDNCRPETQCEKNDGFCIGGCRDGHSGHYCQKQCDSRCSSCTRNDTAKCLKCRGNLSCELFCPDNCFSQDCDGSRCANGCLSGYWGERCEYRCPEDCSADESSTDLFKLGAPVLSILLVASLAMVLSMFLWKWRQWSHEDRNVGTTDVSRNFTNERTNELENSVSQSGNENVCMEDTIQNQYESITSSVYTLVAETNNSENQRIPTTNTLYKTVELEKVQNEEIRDLESNGSFTVSSYITPVI